MSARLLEWQKKLNNIINMSVFDFLIVSSIALFLMKLIGFYLGRNWLFNAVGNTIMILFWISFFGILYFKYFRGT